MKLHGKRSGPQPAARRRRLLAWFDGVRRDLPWRTARSPYGTWISEVMLQQTTVQAVVPYYNRFLELFPDVAALAAAPEPEVLAAWSGLGYYRRARYLHRAARQVMAERAGRLPTTRDGWRELPGVGDYAAGAIASMAHGERVPALDANARRVLTRWAVERPAELADWKPADLRAFAAELVPADRPGDWNEAVMELGAMICTAGEPSCGRCPMTEVCRAGRSGRARDIPPPTRGPAAIPVRAAQWVVRWRGGILLLPPGSADLLPGPDPAGCLRSDLSGLHLGLWSLPMTGWYRRNADGAWPLDDWVRWLARILGRDWPLPGAGPVLVGTVSHGITRYRITAETWMLDLPVRGLVVPRQVGNERAAEPAFFAPGTGWPPVSRLVTKALASFRLPKG